MNELLFLVSAIAVFGGVVLCGKLFGKAGLFAWAAFAPVMANIITAKQITLFGLSVTMGTILFASVFLCTDIISEIYGGKEARKAVWISFAFVCAYIIIAKMAVLFVPNTFDFSQEHFEQIFNTSMRISVVSAALFLLSNLLDVAIYNFMKRRNNGAMWLRNNVATIISNGIENFAFVFLAFYGIMPANECLMIAAGTTVIEIITSICDTPFLYAAKALMMNGKRETA